ncbi:DUF494 family protein [Legionella impletisoli]|uniref:Protein Smg n=1 Tax=Legionella impletisoli TaxID=343510 RepID=A0A917JV23_9GAMM|nr:DUF494 family protein [Legionella impletisoli]GGI88489.1 hypothetical protein GCM10007966_16550 [Legionella impletisoli]
MKDSLFEMLLSLFEKTLSELKESTSAKAASDTSLQPSSLETKSELSAETIRAEILQSPKHTSLRVFTYHEQMKFTKASYQFLMRMLVWDVIHPDTMELIINQLIFSDSRIVTLEEAKWTVRNVLAEILNPDQLAFLDLVLYQKEDEYTVH